MSNGNVAKSYWSGCIGRAMKHQPLTSAVPLLINSRTFGCWVAPWPDSPFIRQPGPVQLPGQDHIEANLSADARST